jgi:signal transduction histidine kinase
MQSGLTVHAETNAHPAVGIDLDLAYSAIPLRNESGQTTGAFVVVSDQTEIKNLARQQDQLLIQQNRMAAMGEMLDNIAHQWRQPLNILGLQVQELRISYKLGNFSEDLLDKGVAKAMEIIQHMSQTIDDFRDFLMLDKEKKLFRVDQVIRKSVSIIEDSLKQYNISLDISHAGDPQINGYPNEYGQVILNILMNAKDAFVEKGKNDATITVRSWAEHGRTVVTITDNAGGIKDEIIGKIFEAYFTTKPLGKGTGVGLFMSSAIIEKSMGGRLSVRNVEGGAEFRIEV